MSSITYNNEDKTSIQLGDRVTIRRFLFWKYLGTVVYVPGISPKRRDMEDETPTIPECRWRKICIKYDNGIFATEDVDSSGIVKESRLKFISRGDTLVGIAPDDIISEEDK